MRLLPALTPALALVAALAVNAPAMAHHIWIELDESGAPIVRFGEFAENLREVSPGLLDRIEVTARLLSSAGETPLEAKKGPRGIALGAKSATGGCILAEDAHSPARERKTGGQTVRAIYQPAARFVPNLNEQPAVLTLDVVPGKTPGQFRVSFKGAPLAKTKVTLMAASGWTRELRTDEAGTIAAELPWKGAYAIEVSHADQSPGTRNGQPFDVTNYVTTLSFEQTAGLDPVPPPPAAKPSG